jgi:hypothetical protein
MSFHLFFLTLARQVLYHLNHSSSPLLCQIVLRQDLMNYLPRLASNLHPPDCCWEARITGMSHQRPACIVIFWSYCEWYCFISFSDCSLCIEMPLTFFVCVGLLYFIYLFIYFFVYVLYYIYWFEYVVPSLHPWDGTYLITVCDLFSMSLDSVSKYFTEDFCICIH